MIPVIAARAIGQMVVGTVRVLRAAFVTFAGSMTRFAKAFEGAGKSVLRASRSAVRKRKSVLKRMPAPKGDWAGLDRQSQQSWPVIQQMNERIDAVTRMVPYIAAAETYWGLQERIPGGPRFGGYKHSLKLVRVGGKRDKFGQFAVIGSPKPLKDRSIDAARQVLYIRPKKTFASPPSKAVRVLHKYSPWTLETLPFSPKKNEAVVVLRRVAKREVQSITRQREKDRPEWRKALEECGVRNVRSDKKAAPELKTSVVQDLAFDALRLEFGYGGVKPTPHWRPAVETSTQFVRRLFKQRSIISKTLTDPKFAAWRKWPPRVESSIKIADLKRTRKFQKRLHIRVNS